MSLCFQPASGFCAVCIEAVSLLWCACGVCFLESSLRVVTALCALRQCHCSDVLVVSFCVSSLLVVIVLCALRWCHCSSVLVTF